MITYEEKCALKPFWVNAGLLASIGDLDVRTLLEGNSVFSEFKGSLTERNDHQQLVCSKAY